MRQQRTVSELRELLSLVCMDACPKDCLYFQDGGYRCQCTPGWTGHHCEDIVGDCSSDPCANGGVCQDLPNGDFTCQCASGFTGIKRDTHGGVMTHEIQYELPSNFHLLTENVGRLCEINIDECSSSPCLNGGSCTNLIDGFQCACSPRFMGETCASPYDPCEAAGADGGCLNGGVCRPLKEERDPGKDFFCQCAEGKNVVNSGHRRIHWRLSVFAPSCLSPVVTVNFVGI